MSVWKTGYNVGLMYGAKKVISRGQRTVSSDWAYTEVFNKLTVSTVWDFTEQILCKSCLFYTEEERKPKLHIKSQYLYFCEYKFCTTISSIVS